MVSFCALLWGRQASAGPDDRGAAGLAPNAPDASPIEASQSAPVTNPGPAPEITVEGLRHAHVEGFTQAEARALPGALGDPLRAVEALPGVTPALSGVPYFFVRGAPPGDVGYFFDGIRLPALFHALGGPSVVHPGLIATVELYPGPYPVEYGRLAAAAVVAHAAEPSPTPRGEVAIRATDSSALLDTPLGDSTNLTLAARYSYADPILHLFASNLNVEYWDYQARVVHQLSDRDGVRVLAFGAHDALTQADAGKTRTLYGIDFELVALRFEHQLPHGSLALQVLGGWHRSFVENGDVRVQDLSTEGRVDLTQALTHQVALRAGMSINHDLYALDASKLDDGEKRTRYLEQFPARLDSAGGMYLAFDADVGSGLSLTAGVRADAYVSRGNTALSCDPRASAEYRVSSRLTLQSAIGIAHQPPANALPAPGLNPTLGQGLQTGVQQSYGFRLRLPSDVSLAVTLFQNALFNVSDSAGLARLGDADKSVSQDTRGLGWSRGVEILLRRSLTRKLGGFLSYTLSSSDRAVGRAEGPSAYDRRHVLGAAFGYDWGRGFRSGARVTFYTGIPADVAYLEAARDPPRTAAFYRVDLRSEKRFLLGDSRYFSLVFEIVNTTLNREVLQASCDAYVCKEQRVGPVTIPNFGIEAGF